MSREELIKAKEYIEKAEQIFRDIEYEDKYRIKTYNLEEIIVGLEKQIHSRDVCNMCGSEEFTSNLVAHDIADGTEMHFCEECSLRIVGYCECGFPITDDDEFCKYCGAVVEEVE